MRQLARYLVLVLGLVLVAAPGWASTQTEIASATGQGKAVFLVVTQGNVRGTDSAVQIAKQAQALAPTSAVVVMDRGAAENQDLVQRLRVLGAPVPLILVMAPNGVVAGGALLKDATPQNLVALIPTPKKARMLLELSQKKAVFVVVSSKTMVEARGKVFEACTQAMQTLEHKAATVTVDADDKAERAFLKELNIQERETTPVVIVFNAKGQKTQVFRQVVTAEQLVQAVHKKVECCPGGSC
jgi:hypothetical protein